MFTGESRFAGGGQQEQRDPIVEVACKHGKWWSIPRAMSAELYELYANGENAVYTCHGGESGRVGSWSPDGQETRINRYMIDRAACVQTNLDNKRKRSIRLVWVRPQDVEHQFTGQLPDHVANDHHLYDSVYEYSGGSGAIPGCCCAPTGPPG